jgi:hypothetical protein
MARYVVAGGLRPVPANGGTAEDAHSYAQQMKIYPLADAAAPKSTRFVDGFPKPYHSLPVYDASWFRELAAMVNEEPVRERDKVMMGMLASIGIERGKPFQPDANTQKARAAALVDARRIMQQYFVAPGRALAACGREATGQHHRQQRYKWQIASPLKPMMRSGSMRVPAT